MSKSFPPSPRDDKRGTWTILMNVQACSVRTGGSGGFISWKKNNQMWNDIYMEKVVIWSPWYPDWPVCVCVCQWKGQQIFPYLSCPVMRRNTGKEHIRPQNQTRRCTATNMDCVFSMSVHAFCQKFYSICLFFFFISVSTSTVYKPIQYSVPFFFGWLTHKKYFTLTGETNTE